MLALALLALLPLQEPPPPVETAPLVDTPAPVVEAPAVEAPVVDAPAPVVEAPVADAPAAPAPDACLALLHEGKREEAQRCYAERANADDGNARLARELADLVATLELRPPTLDASPEPERGFDVAGLVFTGKAELIATSTLVGAYMATVTAAGAVNVLCNSGFGCGGPTVGLVLLAPVVGGGVGLGMSTATILAVDSLNAGDVNVVRAVMLLGAFDSALLPFAVFPNVGSGGAAGTFVAFGMFATQAIAVGAGIGIASITELPEGAGSLALSSALWTSVITILGANMFGAMRQVPPAAIPLVLFGTANVGFAGGMIASPYFPISRAETWAIDVGGAVGLLAGASLAFQPKYAGNPFVGWGTMALGTGIGMGAGFMAARYLPPLAGGLPEIVALSPIIVDDDVDPARNVRGAMVMGRF